MIPLDAVGTGYGAFSEVAPSHAPALLAVLTWPALVIAMRLLRRSAPTSSRAARWLARIEATPLPERVIAGLLLADAIAHLGLVPGHISIAPGKSLLFLVDGVLLGLAAVAVFRWRRWRRAVVPLLLGGLVAYVVFLATGSETPDDVGLLTKLAELLAVGLALAPFRSDATGRRRVWRWTLALGTLLSLTFVNGVAIWALALRDASLLHQGAHAGAHVVAFAGEVRQPSSSATPSAAAQAAAARLVADTRKGIARYQDPAVAIADGYRPSTPINQPTVHYSKQGKNAATGLDPAHPAALVYATTRHGLLLLGALYEMPQANTRGPDFQGAIGGWHMHNNVCLTLVPFGLLDLATPYGFCPVAAIGVNTQEMLHVWTVNNPRGPFGDLDEAYLKMVRAQ